jgi:hypothetical protein
MLTYKVQSTLEKPLKLLNPYIINTKLIVIWFMFSRHIWFMLTRHIQFMFTRHIGFMLTRHIWFMLTRYIQFMSYIMLMLTYNVRSTLEKPLQLLNTYIINTKLIVIWFMLTRHIQFMSNILFFLCCLFISYLCIQFNFSLCLFGLSKKKNIFQNNQEDIKADNSNQLRNDAGRSGRVWLARKKCLASIVSLVPHLNPSQP